MSREPVSRDPVSRDRAAADLRNWVLRLAFAVTLGLAVDSLRGTSLPMLAPVIALQLLAASRVPPGGRMVVLLLLIAATTSGLAYLVSIMTVGFAGLYTIGVGILYLWGFTLALRRGTALVGVMAVTMTVVITGLASTSTGLAFGVLLSLVISVMEAFALVFLAYCVFPATAAGAAPPARKAAPPEDAATLPLVLHALLATIVILPAHVYLNAEGVASMVVLLTMATMLRQPGIAQSTRYCVAIMAGNALGASLAAAAVLLVTVQDHAAVMISVTAAGALFLSWQITRGGRWVPVILPGYVAYTVLFGLVLSPLPLAEEVAVVDRVLSIVAGAVYAMAAISVLAPAIPYLTGLAGLRAARAA